MGVIKMNKVENKVKSVLTKGIVVTAVVNLGLLASYITTHFASNSSCIFFLLHEPKKLPKSVIQHDEI
jgi:hypothetical protein